MAGKRGVAPRFGGGCSLGHYPRGAGKKAKIFLGKAEKRYLLLTLHPFVHIFLRPAFDVGACWSVIRSELHVDDSFKEGLVAPCPDRTKSLEFEWKRMIMRFWIRVPWRS